MKILKLEEIKDTISINHVVFKHAYIYLALLFIIGLLCQRFKR